MKFKKKRQAAQKAHPQQDQSLTLAWFPGHMARAQREIVEALKKVHVIVELRDARLPLTSQNPQLIESISKKKHLIVLNKSNLIAPEELEQWFSYFKKHNIEVIDLNSFQAPSLTKLKKALVELGMLGRTSESKRALKLMVVGLPNTGKSTLINHLAERQAVRAQDRPGLTQKQQWVRINDELEVLDTPGIMRPNIPGPEQGYALHLIHALKEELVDEESAAHYLVSLYLKRNPQTLRETYQLSDEELALSALEIMEAIARKQGHLKKGGEVELIRTSRTLIHDFRQGKLGPFVLELPINP
jgi:ribosome biogenesis GTPase A